jgi:hypothetical protein
MLSTTKKVLKRYPNWVMFEFVCKFFELTEDVPSQ